MEIHLLYFFFIALKRFTTRVLQVSVDRVFSLRAPSCNIHVTSDYRLSL